MSFWLGMSYTTYAQQNGIVLDAKTKDQLSRVNIYRQRDYTGIGMTDNNGTFSISFLDNVDEADTILFSSVGYHTMKTTKLLLKEHGYTVYLYEQTQTLDEVVIQGRRQLLNQLEYVSLADLPKPLFSFASFLINDNIFVIAGDETSISSSIEDHIVKQTTLEFRSHDIYIYDIFTDRWIKEPIKVAARTGHMAHYNKGRAYVIGGRRYAPNRKLEYTDERMEVYDLSKDTIYVESYNPHQAVDFASFIYNDCLYIIGGAVKEKVYSDKIHMLDLKTGYWYDMDTIPKNRQRSCNGILVEDMVYFFGGYRTSQMYDVSSYNLLTGEWKHLCDLPNAVSYPGLATDGKLIYIFENGVLQVYNIRTNSLQKYSLNEELNLEYSGLFYHENKLYIVGGRKRDSMSLIPHAKTFSIDVNMIRMSE
jgi:hypothetical protein